MQSCDKTIGQIPIKLKHVQLVQRVKNVYYVHISLFWREFLYLNFVCVPAHQVQVERRYVEKLLDQDHIVVHRAIKVVVEGLEELLGREEDIIDILIVVFSLDVQIV